MGGRVASFLLGLSLANVVLLRVWAVLLGPRQANRYFAAITRTSIVAAWANVLLWGAVFGALFRMASGRPRARRTTARLLLLAALAFPLNHVRGDVLGLGRPHGVWLLATTGLLLLLGIAAVRWQDRIYRTFTAATLVLAPFLIITGARSIATAASTPPATAATAPVRSASADPSRGGVPAVTREGATLRVVIVIFDELDQRLAFAERPRGLALPAFDRLTRRGVSADSALQAATQTAMSIPAMVLGRPVENANAFGRAKLLLTLDSGRRVDWRRMQGMFAAASNVGARTAVAGYYHRYCAVLGVRLDACYTYPSRAGPWPVRLVRTMGEQQKSLLLRSGAIVWQDTYAAVHRRALAFVRDTTLDLVFLHYPIPHGPWIYDRSADRLTFFNERPDGYFDNVALADRALGELTAELETSPAAARTALIVTSDHAARDGPGFGRLDPRVPFLVTVGDDTASASVDRPFRGTILRDLALALLAGEIRDNAAVAGWITARAAEHGYVPVGE